MRISKISSDESGLRSWNRRSGARMIADIPSVTAPVVHSSFSHIIRFEMASEQAVRKAQPKATKNQFMNPIPLSSKTDGFQTSGYSTDMGAFPIYSPAPRTFVKFLPGAQNLFRNLTGRIGSRDFDYRNIAD